MSRFGWFTLPFGQANRAASGKPQVLAVSEQIVSLTEISWGRWSAIESPKAGKIGRVLLLNKPRHVTLRRKPRMVLDHFTPDFRTRPLCFSRTYWYVSFEPWKHGTSWILGSEQIGRQFLLRLRVESQSCFWHQWPGNAGARVQEKLPISHAFLSLPLKHFPGIIESHEAQNALRLLGGLALEHGFHRHPAPLLPKGPTLHCCLGFGIHFGPFQACSEQALQD